METWVCLSVKQVFKDHNKGDALTVTGIFNVFITLDRYLLTVF